MCNGDLGMYRVMPWAYPTIPGQSSGGASVDPIPPEPAGPYDFSNFTLKFLEGSSNIYTPYPDDHLEWGYSCAWIWTGSGLVENDTSNVSSISIKFVSGNILTDGGKTLPVSNLRLSYSHGISQSWSSSRIPGYADRESAAFTRSYGDSNNLSGQVITGFSSDTTVLISVYNSNGELLQSKEVVVS